MKLEEVHAFHTKTSEKRNKFLKEIKLYFEEKGFNPYVTMDDIDRVHIKIRYPRKTQRDFPKSEDVQKVYAFGQNEKLQKLFGIKLIWSTTTISTQYSLPIDVRDLWETEFIYKQEV